MLTLLEFCDEFKISHAKAKRMMKRGALLVSDMPDKATAKIVETLAQRNPLAASDLCTLLEAPGMALQLGRYSQRALDQLDTIGDAVAEQAPYDVALSIMDAANQDPEAIATLISWIKGALPFDGRGVTYCWLACRLLLPLPANVRQFENAKIVRALAHCRKSEKFAGWWKYERKSGRNVTIYAFPTPLDL